MTQTMKTQSAQDSRVQKAKEIEVENVFEPRDNVYVADFVNERGEERQRVLIPSKLFSDSADMIYRADEYVCGKYLLAAAREHSGVRSDLALALEQREQEASEKLNNIETAESALQSEL